MSDPTLKLTDGTTDISLLRGEDEFGLHLSEWTPAIADYKNEGIWRDSSLADGRRLVDHRWANVVETYELVGNGYEQNDLIRTMQDARRLLEKAASYWSSNWQDEPVWIEAKAKCETNTRYGLVYRGRIPEDDNPYAQPFFRGESAVLDDLALMVERLPWWLGFAPVDPCETQSTESQSYCFPSHLEFGDAANDNVNCGSGATVDDLPDFAVAGKGQVTLEAYVRADGFGRIIDKGYIAFLINSAAGLYCTINCATQNALSTSGLDEFSADGLWHHVLATYDETGAGTPAARTIYLAIGGVWVTSYVVQTPSIGNYTSDAAIDLLIGNATGLANVFDGGIAWVRISDSIRYDPAGGDFTPEPRCKLPDIDANVVLQVIYEGTGTTTYDRSGNDNDGAITGATWGCDCTTTDEDDVDCDCVEASGDQEWEYKAQLVQNTALPVGAVYAIDTDALDRTYAGDTDHLWRTDDGTNWTDATTPPGPNFSCRSIAINGNTVMLAGVDTVGGNPEVWVSTDRGLNFAIATATQGTSHVNSLIYRESDSYWYMADDQGTLLGILRSNDNGVTWQHVFGDVTVRSIYLTGNDVLLTSYGATFSVIVRSTDGSNWSVVRSIVATDLVCAWCEDSDNNVYCGTDVNSYMYISGDDGLTWTDLPLLGDPTIWDMIYADGRLWTSTGNIYYGANGRSWILVGALGPGATFQMHYRTASEQLFLGTNGSIYELDLSDVSIGRSNTCLDEAMIVNKKNIAQLTHVSRYDTGTAAWVDLYPDGVWPAVLFGSPMVNGDAILFSIDSSVLEIGPFCSLIFDILKEAVGTYTVTWYYPSGGGAAFPPPGAGWTALNVYDETSSFSITGVRGVYWVPPSDWDNTVAINGVTGWHIVAIIGGVAGAPTPPIQQHRDIYTVTWPDIDVDDAQVLGDIPALLYIKAHNRSDEDYYDTKDELDLLSNRMLIGLRSLDRGLQYVSYINIAEDGIVASTYAQNPIGIMVTDGTGTTTGANNRSAAGICAVHTTPPTGSLSTYADAATITFGPSIARDFYGTYHVFLRAQLEEPSSSPSGDDADVQVRLQVRSGSGGITFTTQHRRFVGWDANTEVYKDFQLLDFGRINLPVSSLFRSTELPNEFTIIIQISSASGTNLEVNLYDLVLIPVDEWAGDFIDSALEDDSGVGNGYRLDVDSLTYPKRRIRALVRSANSSEFIKAAYQPITPGPAILQANADQRLWFLSARAVYLGKDTAGAGLTLTDTYSDFIRAGVKPGMTVYDITGAGSATVVTVNQTTLVTDSNIWALNDEYMIVCNGIYRSEPWVVHSVQLRHNPRYLSFRGNR